MEKVISQNPYTPFVSNRPHQLQSLFIAGSATTPIVLFDTKKEYLMLKGISCPENSPTFYNVIVEYLRRYQHHGAANLKVYFNFDYINTSTSKSLFGLTLVLDSMRRDGMNITINWCYDEDDSDMQESGEDISELAEVDFNFIQLESLN